MEYLKYVDGGVILFSDEPDEDYIIGQEVVIADCDGFGPPGSRFKHVCVCGYECTSGRSRILKGIEPLTRRE